MTSTTEATPAADVAGTPNAPGYGGKYLTFVLDGEDYGVDVLKIREIIGVQDITRVPQSADFVRGVINLRGKVIPVLDLRTKFGLPPAEYNEQTCIIVVDVGALQGVIVDTVREVQVIPSADIEPAPELGGGANTEFILGMGKVKGEVKMLLDIDKVVVSGAFVHGAGPSAE